MNLCGVILYNRLIHKMLHAIRNVFLLLTLYWNYCGQIFKFNMASLYLTFLTSLFLVRTTMEIT